MIETSVVYCLFLGFWMYLKLGECVDSPWASCSSNPIKAQKVSSWKHSGEIKPYSNCVSQPGNEFLGFLRLCDMFVYFFDAATLTSRTLQIAGLKGIYLPNSLIRAGFKTCSYFQKLEKTSQKMRWKNMRTQLKSEVTPQTVSQFRNQKVVPWHPTGWKLGTLSKYQARRAKITWILTSENFSGDLRISKLFLWIFHVPNNFVTGISSLLKIFDVFQLVDINFPMEKDRSPCPTATWPRLVPWTSCQWLHWCWTIELLGKKKKHGKKNRIKLNVCNPFLQEFSNWLNLTSPYQKQIHEAISFQLETFTIFHSGLQKKSPSPALSNWAMRPAPQVVAVCFRLVSWCVNP